MTLAVPDQPTLTECEARELTAQIYGQLEAAWQLIIRAYQGRAWIALGYESWDTYCKAEFNGARLRLPREERQEIVGSLREAGLSTRAIASATGVSKDTVHRDLAPVSNETPDAETEPSNVVGLDGKTYAPRPAVTDLISGNDLAELNGKPRQDEPIDAEVVDDPLPLKPPRRRPIAESVHEVGREMAKAAQRLERLLDDDRITKNKEQVADACADDLLRTAAVLAAAITKLQLEG